MTEMTSLSLVSSASTHHVRHALYFYGLELIVKMSIVVHLFCQVHSVWVIFSSLSGDVYPMEVVFF